MRIFTGNRYAFFILTFVLLASVAPLAAQSASEEPATRSGFDYVIGVEDVLEVSVWKNPELSVTIPVRPDGKISLPLIDDVTAAGLTPEELKKTLTSRWEGYLSTPEVSVLVREINSIKVYVLGEVARAGELRPKSRIRLLQALSLVGGFTQFADKSKIILLRDNGGKEERFEINYNKVVSGDSPEDNFVLRPGDTIVVP